MGSFLSLPSTATPGARLGARHPRVEDAPISNIYLKWIFDSLYATKHQAGFVPNTANDITAPQQEALSHYKPLSVKKEDQTDALGRPQSSQTREKLQAQGVSSNPSPGEPDGSSSSRHGVNGTIARWTQPSRSTITPRNSTIC